MQKRIFSLLILLISGCADIQTNYPLTKEDIVVVPNPNAFGAPVEAPIKDVAALIMTEINPVLQKQQQTLDALMAMSKKQLDAAQRQNDQAVEEITLFFDRGMPTLEYSFFENERLVDFLDYMIRKSPGKKIYFVCIGNSSEAKDLNTNIQLAVERARAPVALIEKYLVNVPFEIVDTYAVKSIGESKLADEAKYQSVRIIATFDKDKLPSLPN